MHRSIWTKVVVVVLVLAISFTFAAGSATSPVYAHHWGGGGGWGGGGWGGGHHWGGGGWGGGGYGGWCCSYSSWYYPYYSYYYPYSYGYSWGYPYYSNYYNGYSSYSPAQYTLTVSANPSSLASQVTGGGSYSYGSTASFSVSQAIVQTAPDTQYVFQGWTGGYTGSATSGSITMTSSSTVTAVYQP